MDAKTSLEARWPNVTEAYIADLKPGGRDVAKDMFEAGGIPLLMRTLHRRGECRTVTGRTIAASLEGVRWKTCYADS
jgi:dihydroxyacid dehydratase/phosphogluconate dehydratase